MVCIGSQVESDGQPLQLDQNEMGVGEVEENKVDDEDEVKEHKEVEEDKEKVEKEEVEKQ